MRLFIVFYILLCGIAFSAEQTTVEFNESLSPFDYGSWATTALNIVGGIMAAVAALYLVLKIVHAGLRKLSLNVSIDNEFEDIDKNAGRWTDTELNEMHNEYTAMYNKHWSIEPESDKNLELYGREVISESDALEMFDMYSGDLNDFEEEFNNRFYVMEWEDSGFDGDGEMITDDGKILVSQDYMDWMLEEVPEDQIDEAKEDIGNWYKVR